MAIKKSELYSSLWSSCDELRGGMDASQYKDYVLVLLFIKYVSDRYAGQPYAPITIPKGASFAAFHPAGTVGIYQSLRHLDQLLAINTVACFVSLHILHQCRMYLRKPDVYASIAWHIGDQTYYT